MENVINNEVMETVENAVVETGRFDWKQAGEVAIGVIVVEAGYRFVAKPVFNKIKKTIQEKKAKKNSKDYEPLETIVECEGTETTEE